jgi:serine/threonine-protein kinase HipA
VTILSVWLEGFDVPIGVLSSDVHGAVQFSYAIEWIKSERSFPLSLSLPLREAAYGDSATRTFFQNLLPENRRLISNLLARERLEDSDLVGILSHVGADCAGAVSCLPAGAPPVKQPGNLFTDYDRLTELQLDELIRRMTHRLPMPTEIRFPSPVAGVRDKLCLTVLYRSSLGLPKVETGAPTTHILKVPNEGDEHEPRLEAAASFLAQMCGVDAAKSVFISFGGINTLLTTRFDRVIMGDEVRRIHQEDFAQALGLPPSLKYEHHGTADQRFSAVEVSKLLDQTAEPLLAKQKFMIATLFNIMIGNNDNHAKNHALLYDQGKRPRFAPLYDLVPTVLDPKYDDHFAFKIGNAARRDDLDKASLMDFAATMGLSEAAFTRFADRTLRDLIQQIDLRIADFTHPLKSFGDMISGELHRFNTLLSLNIPLRERDYFQARGGGWQIS